MLADPAPRETPWRDMAFYEKLIRRGIAEADARASAIDHVTARRIAIWLLPRSQDEPELMRSLVHFARTGGITDHLRQRLRRHARTPGHPAQSQAAWLLQYTAARGRHPGRIGDNFGAICDQIDYADAVLEDLRERVQHSRQHPEPAATDWQEKLPLKPTALCLATRPPGPSPSSSTARSPKPP